MAKIMQIFLISCTLLLSCKNLEQKKNIIVGAEQTDQYIHLIKNKKVGLVVNQTSLINKTHIVDSLISHNINVVKIFSPEHGFRGKADAGTYIKNDIDSKTGIPIISLYGDNKKPTKEHLKDLEIIIFDIQDVGARFYTYISTLHYVMESIAENNLELIVLDRPNPNIHYVDGPIRKKEYASFVGMHEVPIVHGMTIGEYAKMINGEKWINKKCKLTIISIQNYNRDNKYELPVRPSPNLPNSKSINLYPSLCLFEGTNVSVGRGTDKPFQHYGSPDLNSYSYTFIPKSGPGSKFPKHENRICIGRDLENYKFLRSINLGWLIESYNNTINKEKFFNNFFDKLAGSDQLRKQIINGLSEKEIKRSWQNDLEKFKKIRKKYLIYN